MQDILTRLNPLNRMTLIGKLRYYFFDRYYDRTVQWLLAGTAILLTVLATLMFRNVDLGANPMSGLILIAPIVAVAGFLLLYHNMHLNLLVFLPMSLLLWEGVSVGGGTKISFLFILILGWLIIWFYKMLVIERRITIAGAAANKFAWTFIVMAIIAYFWGWAFVDPMVKQLYDSRFNPRTMTLVMFIISPLTYMFIATHVRSIKHIKWFVIGFLATAIPFAYLKGIWAESGLLNWNGQYPVWVAAIATGQLLYNQHLKLWHRGLLLAMIAYWSYIQLGLGLTWLSGWVPVTFVITFITFNYSRRLFFLLILAAVIWVIANSAMLADNFARETEESGDTRNLAWSTAMEYIVEHPLFGMGPAGYAFYYALDNWPANFSHNNYIDVLAQTGVAGFIPFVLIWVAMCWTAWRTYLITPKGGFRGALATSLFASMVAVLIIMMLGDWVTPFTYTQGLFGINYTIWPWMLAGLTIALRYEVLNHLKEQKQAESLTVLTAGSNPAGVLPAPSRS
jgi:O-antigen ligase